MSKAKKPTFRERLACMLEIPRDLAFQDCIITWIGEREILLENYRGIQEYRSDHLLVQTQKGNLHIQGTSISILSYTEHEMQISGEIQAIFYEKQHQSSGR